MDSIGNYLYVIIFVGIIIFNILKVLRKQGDPAQQMPDSSEHYPYSTSDEEDEVEENPWQSTTDLQKERERITHQPTMLQFLIHGQQSSRTEPVTVKKSVKKKEAVNLLNEENSEEKSILVEFKDTDDARKAFLYSEIWNKKYNIV